MMGELYRADALPVFQNRTYGSREEARCCARGDVVLLEHPDTGLVQNAAFRPELVQYDAHYQNDQGMSPAFHRHLDEVVDLVERMMRGSAFVEIGCGQGLFLTTLAARGADVVGFDPAYEGDDPRIRKRYFRPGESFGQRAVILRHVLEHIADPLAFLAALRDANDGGGLIYIEVPCFEWTCRRRAWFDICYEHVNYFRLSDFHRIFGSIRHASRSFGGQYLSVVADLASLRHPTRDPAEPPVIPEDFLRTLRPRDMRGAAIWGGSTKGTVFALMIERAGSPAAFVIDISPAKQGRYLPGSGLPVLAPREGLARLSVGSEIYVMNRNYLNEVRAMAGDRFRYRVVDDE